MQQDPKMSEILKSWTGSLVGSSVASLCWLQCGCAT